MKSQYFTNNNNNMNISNYNLLQEIGGADSIGPVLLGLKKPVHVLQLGSSIRSIFNMVLIAVVDAQIKSAANPPEEIRKSKSFLQSLQSILIRECSESAEDRKSAAVSLPVPFSPESKRSNFLPFKRKIFSRIFLACEDSPRMGSFI